MKKIISLLLMSFMGMVGTCAWAGSASEDTVDRLQKSVDVLQRVWPENHHVGTPAVACSWDSWGDQRPRVGDYVTGTGHEEGDRCRSVLNVASAPPTRQMPQVGFLLALRG